MARPNKRSADTVPLVGEQWVLVRIATGFAQLRAASTAVIIEDEQTDRGRKISVVALAALVVDGLHEVVGRSALSNSNFLERSPEGVLQAHAGFMPADTDGSFENQGFSAFGWSHVHQRLVA